MKTGNRCTVKCLICGTYGHTDKKCPVYELNRQQEASQADRDKLVALGLNPDLEAQLERIRESWKQEHKTIQDLRQVTGNSGMRDVACCRQGGATPPLCDENSRAQVAGGFAARAALMLSAKFKRCAYLVLFCVLLPHLHAGTITGQIQTATGGVINNGTLGFTLSQPAVLSGTATLSTAQAYCYTSTVGNIVGLPDPLALPVLSTNTGSGTLAAGTYYVMLTYYGAGGETVASPEMSVVLSAQGTVIVNAPTLQPASATGYKVYIGATSGSETLQATITGFTQYQQASALTAGSALPSSNSTVCSLVFSDQLIPTGTYYTVSFVNKNGSMISGFPETWCTFGGSAGTINVSNGAPTGNCGTNGVFYPTPIFANPQNNAAQSESGPFTFQSNVTFNAAVSFTSSVSFSQGILAPFFQSSSINPAQSGVIRLESGDLICWRNNANSADVCISKNASDQFVMSTLSLSNLLISTNGTLTNAGVFTNTQMNSYFLSLINSCNPGTQFSAEQAGSFATDGMDGCVSVPVSSTVHQANGMAGYATNLSTTTDAVGGYFMGRALAGSVKVWGSNMLVSDAGFSSTTIVGQEVDVNISGSSTSAIGQEINGVQNSPGNTATPAAWGRVGGLVLGGNWNTGYSCATGSLNVTSNYANGGACLLLPPGALGNSQPSYAVVFAATNSGGSHPYAFMTEEQTGVIGIAGSPLHLNPAGGSLIFSNLPSCAANTEGTIAPISDSTTNTWGNTITGTGTDHVLAYCDGTNWTVAAK